MDICGSQLIDNIRVQQKKLFDIEKKIKNIVEEHEYYQELELQKKNSETLLLKTVTELVLSKSEDVFSKIKDTYKILENIELELREKEDNLVKFKKEKEIIDKELEKLSIDLVEQKKIEWVNMSFEDWYELSYDEEQENFWIYSTECGNDMGIWKGYDQLSLNDIDHFDTFELDYFYYGGPNYYNCYYPNSEMSEAEMAREAGCANIKRINRHEL
ncbi:hypothetical protein CPAV1605_173 [seawater metagenome]|uniref:Uncharacterized protein n=1 Tax=seawater metagenome TaxID=1561972 RepID=A0A5E8CGY8_9ZZZZ